MIDLCFLHLFFSRIVVDPNNWYQSKVHNERWKKDQGRRRPKTWWRRHQRCMTNPRLQTRFSWWRSCSTWRWRRVEASLSISMNSTRKRVTWNLLRSISMTKSRRWFYYPVCQRPGMVSWWRWAIPLWYESWSWWCNGCISQQETRRKSSGSAETSRSALSVDQRGRPMNREKKKNDKSKSKSGRGYSKSRGTGCWAIERRGIFRGSAIKRRTGKAKAKRRILCMS